MPTGKARDSVTRRFPCQAPSGAANLRVLVTTSCQMKNDRPLSSACHGFCKACLCLGELRVYCSLPIMQREQVLQAGIATVNVLEGTLLPNFESAAPVAGPSSRRP